MVEIERILEEYPYLKMLINVKNMKFFSLIAANQPIRANRLLELYGKPKQTHLLKSYVAPIEKEGLIKSKIVAAEPRGRALEYSLNMKTLGKPLFSYFGQIFFDRNNFIIIRHEKTKSTTIDLNEELGDIKPLEVFYGLDFVKKYLNPQKMHGVFGRSGKVDDAKNLELLGDATLFCIKYMKMFFNTPVFAALYYFRSMEEDHDCHILDKIDFNREKFSDFCDSIPKGSNIMVKRLGYRLSFQFMNQICAAQYLKLVFEPMTEFDVKTSTIKPENIPSPKADID